jgi:DNA-binding response OmpR family regulator
LTSPDIVLLGVDWRSRALIRAQLIEEGYEVIAVDDWPTARRVLRLSPAIRVAIVDLEGLVDPVSVLREIRLVVDPSRVLVLGGLGTIVPSDIRSLGLHAIFRPFTIRDVVTEVALRAGRHEE